ncbi:uncharacterized protein LOC134571373 [Pelobates fuscus]|uniref:uncharacterized protein LOC134571373 n=1 Tax=Pelobates fuscus TaxID=191477 RepID=UPI002FE4BE66
MASGELPVYAILLKTGNEEICTAESIFIIREVSIALYIRHDQYWDMLLSYFFLCLSQFVSEKYRVGIFSRSAEEEYSWLQTLLRSKGFRDRVQEVRPCYISNSGYRQFTQNVSQCTFGILYHTKNRGRINITDVTDSLYDKELEYLSEKLGKKKVVVVIDDLKDSGSEQKIRILENQPSIGRLAQNLILIGSKDKMSNKTDIISHRDLFANSM